MKRVLAGVTILAVTAAGFQTFEASVLTAQVGELKSKIAEQASEISGLRAQVSEVNSKKAENERETARITQIELEKIGRIASDIVSSLEVGVSYNDFLALARKANSEFLFIKSRGGCGDRCDSIEKFISVLNGTVAIWAESIDGACNPKRLFESAGIDYKGSSEKPCISKIEAIVNESGLGKDIFDKQTGAINDAMKFRDAQRRKSAAETPYAISLRMQYYQIASEATIRYFVSMWMRPSFAALIPAAKAVIS